MLVATYVAPTSRSYNRRMTESSGSDTFTEKWRARWPEWRVAEVFVPRDERERMLAWFALRQELTDAAWGGSDPQPGEAKLAWWAEELDGWAHGRRRHPLGQVLQRQLVPWGMLVACLPALHASREPAGDTTQAIEVLEPFAEGVAGVAATLYHSDTPAPARSVVVGLLAERLLTQGVGAVPRHIQVDGGSADPDAAARAWANELLQCWPPAHDGTRPGRIHAALLRARLQAFAADKQASLVAVSYWRALHTAWRAARG